MRRMIVENNFGSVEEPMALPVFELIPIALERRIIADLGADGSA